MGESFVLLDIYPADCYYNFNNITGMLRGKTKPDFQVIRSDFMLRKSGFLSVLRAFRGDYMI